MPRAVEQFQEMLEEGADFETLRCKQSKMPSSMNLHLNIHLSNVQPFKAKIMLRPVIEIQSISSRDWVSIAHSIKHSRP